MALVAAILYKFYYLFDWKIVWNTLLCANIIFMIIAVLFFFLKIVNDSYRWYRMTMVFGINVPYLNLLRYNTEAIAFDFVTPLPQAEEFYRFGRLSFYTDKLSAAIVVAGIRFAGSLALLFTFPISLYNIPGVSERITRPNSKWFLCAAIITVLFPLLFLYWKRKNYSLPAFLQQYVVRFKQLKQNVKNKKGTLSESFLLAILSQAFYAASIYFLSKSLMFSVSFLDCLCVIPLLFAATFIPIGVAGLGIKEAVVIWTFQRLGVPLSIAMSIALLHFTIMTVYIGVGGLIFVKDGLRKKQYVKT